MSTVQELDHLRIPFDDIKSATNNFDDQNFLGQGGFGRVYYGQLPSTCSTEPGTNVAVKRFDVKGGQGEHEFLMEIVMLASYKHDNLVSLVGFSDDGDEKVLVYKQEVNGSLDKHLASTELTWEQRLQICLGAAQGLEYLHGGVGTEHRVLHRDIKSSNILLDENWKAKISDFGLSKIGPSNQQFTFLVTKACGTLGYLDPVYVNTGVLTKESDVYSFGVVLFEVLCGRLAMIWTCEDERRFLSRLVKLHKENGTLHLIIPPRLLEQIDPYSLEAFCNIAFQCLSEDRKQRPTMDLVVKGLETALKHHLVKGTTVSEAQFGPRTKLWGSVTGGSPFLFQLEDNQKLRKITIIHDRLNRWIRSLSFTVEDSDGLLHSSDQYGGLHDPDYKGEISVAQRELTESLIIHDRLNCWIRSLSFTVEDSDGLLHSSDQYGGLHDPDYKGEISVIEFDTNEEMIGICGTVGIIYGLVLIFSLSFVTNNRMYGPFGQVREADAHFSESWDLGSFDGFYGRCGWYLDAVGCCLKTIKL